MDDTQKAPQASLSAVEQANGHRIEAQQPAASAAAALAKISAALAQAKVAASEIIANQAIIAQKSAHIQAAQEHADKIRAALDRVLTNATQLENETDGVGCVWS